MLDYTIEVVTPPASEPVTVSELKSHLRLNSDDEDTELEEFITAARQAFEAATGRIVITTTLKQHQSKWTYPIKLYRANVQSVVSVTYFDTDDTEQSLGGYLTDLLGVPALVYLPDSSSYPTLSVNKPRPVVVRFTAGFSTVPSDVKLAIKMLAGHYYENREAFNSSAFEARTVPFGFERIVNQYKTGLI